MGWVLWDILIPLLASFALGVLLFWLMSRVRRKSNNRVAATHAGDSLIGSDSEIANTGVSVDAGIAEMDGGMEGAVDVASGDLSQSAADAYGLKDLESANITLIGERDEALYALENLQAEADEMKQQIIGLEAEAEAGKTNLEEPNSGLTAPLVSADNNDAEDLKLLQSDMEQLTTTLERERKSRRATELELLNIKNRHDKLEQDIELTVTADRHETAVAERDDEISLLKQQLASQVERHETYKAEVAEVLVDEEPQPEEVIESVEMEKSEQPVADDLPVAEVETGYEDASPILSTDQEELVEPAVSQAHNQEAASGHAPKGWTVYKTAPTKKERDKLTDIKGVGPVLEKILHKCSIYYFRQIADLDENGMEELQSQIPQFPGRIKRDKWVAQAKKLQKKKYGQKQSEPA